MRIPWPAVAVGTLAVAVGAAGLIRAAVPESSAAPAGQSSSAAGPIAITNAYVHAPVPPNRNAAAYFTVYNTTAVPDRLVSVITGAGPTAVIHSDSGGSMAAMTDGVVIPAHGTLRLHAGQEHVMIENVYGTLPTGSTVNIQLTFQNAGQINVVAPVVPLTQNGPTP